MTGLPSRLGFGVSGAHATPLVPRAQTLALIERAVAGGARILDTAPAYGGGEAERRLGLALKRLDRDRVFISTKAGVTGSALTGRRRDFSPEAIERSLAASLARLGVQSVDALFLHGPGPEDLTTALFQRLDRLKAAGAFGALGAAGRGPDLDAALQTGRFDFAMLPVHPFLDDAAQARLQRLKTAGLAVIGIETAGEGAPTVRAPRRPSDLYGLAKALRARRPAGPSDGRRVGPAEGLRAALARAEVDAALFTTTRGAHLDADLAAAGPVSAEKRLRRADP